MCMCLCVHVYVFMCLYSCVCIHVFVFICMCSCVFTFMFHMCITVVFYVHDLYDLINNMQHTLNSSTKRSKQWSTFTLRELCDVICLPLHLPFFVSECGHTHSSVCLFVCVCVRVLGCLTDSRNRGDGLGGVSGCLIR